MTARRIPILVHLLGAALAAALAAYWILRLLGPAPSVVPLAAPATTFREPDAALAARMLGDLGSGPAASSLNIQLSGVFAAGKDSSAVIAVEGRPPRAVLLGHEVAPGFRLVEVRPDGVTLEHEGLRTQYAVPGVTLAKATAAAPMFSREGDTLTAPSQDVSTAAKSAAEGARPGATGAATFSAPQPAAQPAPASASAPALGAAPEEASMPGRVGRGRHGVLAPAGPSAPPPSSPGGG